MIPFSPPRIDEKTIAAVTEVLRSGWITTGPKVRELEARINSYVSSKRTLCLNSWTNAAELALRWFGCDREEGAEIIVPAYTYAATANIVMHCKAKLVIVDSSVDDFSPDAELYHKSLTAKTRAILPVDIGGISCDFESLMKLSRDAANEFGLESFAHTKLGRPLVLADSAHSFGAKFNGKAVGSQCDIHGFSFHAVKNLTTAEGGALTFNLPSPIDNDEVWNSLNISALHGQTKDALAKSKAGQWRYDIVEPGYKCNMTDLHAAIGLVEMNRYEVETLPRRKTICESYMKAFLKKDWFIAPVLKDDSRESSYHLFMLRAKGIDEKTRDRIIETIAENGVSVNVHFQPLPMLSYYRKIGFRIEDFPNAYRHYSSEISLPVYYDMSDEQVQTVIQVVTNAVEKQL